MNNLELLSAVKVQLGYDVEYIDETIDKELNMKINAVKGFMVGAGMSNDSIFTDQGIATLAMGVNDVSILTSGEAKLSEAFKMFVTQMACGD